MSQNPDYETRLREIKEGDPTALPQPAENTFHAPWQIAKKLVIIWDDGRKASFVYSYMHAFMLDVSQNQHRFILYFMAHKVNLTGFRLDLLFDRFISDEPFIVAVVSERYQEIEADDQFLVTQAEIEP